MLKSSDTVRTLLAAKERISTEDKWCQGRTLSPDGSMCLGLAIRGGPGIPRHQRLQTIPAWAVVEEITRRDYGCELVSFNDRPATTHADVLKVLDEAIATVE